MGQQVKDFKAFYALLKQMPGVETEHVKESLVWHFTGLRTYSLREMTLREYKEMLRYMRDRVEQKPEEKVVKKLRSGILHRLQMHGVDTTRWQDVNDFLSSPRIAGKRLYEMSVEEMRTVIRKLERILERDKEIDDLINEVKRL